MNEITFWGKKNQRIKSLIQKNKWIFFFLSHVNAKCSLKLVCVSAEDKGCRKTIRLLDEPLLLLSVNVMRFTVVFIHKCCKPCLVMENLPPICLELPW